jgi:hypothetical protein
MRLRERALRAWFTFWQVLFAKDEYVKHPRESQ